ncbi:translocation/assembly module TamB domain-containing protein [Iningainema tapete]|uniref:Translocation/assembly module TamB domain-containing protein n=1 Tax=Iningainema tapete BLCC-T55 TaxID=2748662 RepID=A0A8J6XAH8_9CYAN|nr:translocation/assembly module TamB domain-containing protein [Iningainema tapete]MBD2770799.1 translocation/assembly module TamB domain-containing protein [Iningainema tapete BLCC-T55]
MANPSNPEPNSNSRNRNRQLLMVVSRGGIALGGLLLVGLVGGAWRLWMFVDKELTPLVAKNLTTTLNRPVQLGEIEEISLVGIKFGSSSLPPTPTDPDKATVDGVEVGFDPIQLLFTRRLKLDVTLVNADAYLEQDQQGRWISTSLAAPGPSGIVKIELDKIRLRNAKLVLAARQAAAKNAVQTPQAVSPPLDTPVAIAQLDGTAQFLENNQLVRYEVAGKPVNGGSISIQGETRVKSLDTNLQLQTQDFLAADITRIIKLPLTLQAGRINNSNLKLQWRQQQDPLLFGSANVQGVRLQVPQLPQPFLNSQGNLNFQGTQIQLQNVGTSYGKIPLIANGILDTKAGFKLAARVNAVSLANAQETLKINLPVPVAGEVQADVQVVGPTTKPVVSGTVVSNKPAKIDKVDISSLRSKFEFNTEKSEINISDVQARATVGGEVTGGGRIKLGTTPQLNFNFAAANFAGDAIATAYETQLPIKIGTVAATAQLSGTSTTVQTSVQWLAPNATYPARGTIIVSPDKTVLFRNVALQVAGGTVQASGSWANQRYSAVADTNQIQVARLVKPEQLQNVSLDDARFNGRIIVSGTTGPFKIGSIRTSNARVQVGGGAIAISNVQLSDQNFSAQLVANGVQLSRVLKTKLPITPGPLAGTFQIAGNTSDISVKTLRATGNARLGIGGGTVTASNIQLADGIYQAQVQAADVAVQQLAQVPKQFQGRLNGRFNVAGSAESISPQTIQATGQARVNIAGGTVTASNIQLANGRYQAQVQANKVQVQRLAQVPPQFQGALTGQFNVAGAVDSFSPKSIQAAGKAQLNVAGGTVTASNIQLANGRYQAQVQANNVQVQRLASVPPQFQGALNGQLNVAGTIDSLSPQSIQATGEAQLSNVAGGKVTASNIQLANGRYQALVDATGVQLSRLSQQLKGQFGGKLQVAGTLEPQNLASLQNISAAGEVEFSQGVVGIEQPLTAQIAWDGQKLNIARATSPDLNVSGYVLANAKGVGIPEITEINLNVQAQNYNLQKIPFQLPNAVALAGIADFNGQITGKLPVPNVQGQVNLRNLVVNRLAFEPVLTGNVKSVQGEGVNFDVGGTRDRIAVSLNSNDSRQGIPFNVSSFVVRWQDALATGQAQGDNLAVKVDNFPLAVLNIKPPPKTRLGAGVVAGLLTANLQVNQKTFAAAGDLAIAKPQVGRIKGDSLNAQFSYGDGAATITSSQFVKGESLYALAGTFNQTANGPQVKGKVNITQGKIQDVLAAAQLFDLQDLQNDMTQEPNYGSAADLKTTTVGLPNQTLYTQLQRFSEIDALLAQQQEQQRDSSILPRLAELTGTFNGEIAVDTTTASGLAANFNLNGQNFVWGKQNSPNPLYRADQIIAQGNFANGVLTLLPLRIESKDRLIAFTGNVGGKEQSGQLRVTNFPIQVLNNFVKLPINVTGNLNLAAALAGNIQNPLAKGELQIVDGTLNQKKVDSATASFSYDNGRLNFGSTLVVASPEPVTVTGSIPYKLPFAAVEPASNEVNLDVNVKNEGLALLNLFTNQVAFENGEGQVNLTVRGTLKEPLVTGVASVNNATFSAQALPGQLTNVTGRALFDRYTVNVENLQGNFSQGKIAAQGEIPIFSQEQQITNPLSVTLDQLAVNIKALYQGGVTGKLQITGAVLNPVISGQIQVANGQVLLPTTGNTTTVASNNIDVAGVKQLQPQSPDSNNTVPEFDNLQLTLGNNVEIASPPLLSFRATGDLTVNGPLNAPVPEGTVRLRGGGVNLFTTQFNLTRNAANTATFRANQPRDPDLDVSLEAKVLDSGPRQIINTPLATSEINEQIIANIEPVRTIRVEARVDGPASQLNNNLELRSSPSRSETEIVALLGGSFIETLGRGDSTLGLVNLAGSALNIQQTFSKIGNSLGLSEFRLFPTLSYPTEGDEKGSSSSSSTLDLAAEIGVDISRNFSLSALKILTADNPPQFGVNYRFNPEFRLRTSTDLNDDTRAVVEYESRF